MSKYFFQSVYDVVTGNPTPGEQSAQQQTTQAITQAQQQATEAIQAISAAIPPPPPPPALTSTIASGAQAGNAAAAAAGQGYGGTLGTGPQGAPLPSVTGGKALLGQ